MKNHHFYAGQLIKKCLFFCLLLSLFFSSPKAKAGIVRIVITSIEPAFGGKTFGKVGPYEKLKGKAYGEVNPKLPQNALITDLELAPRNARGMVEYSMDIYILKPIELKRGNHKIFAEIPNRGSKLFGGFNKSNGGNEPVAAEQAGDGFLMQMGYTIVWSGWDISAGTGNNNMTITVPVATNKDGTAVTGPSYEYISLDNTNTSSYRLTYPAVSLVKNGAVLTVRKLLNDAHQTIPSSEWEYKDNQTISLLPAGTPFQQSAIYEFIYTAKNPLVAGIGLAATRDFISFLRYAKTDSDKHANPLDGEIAFTYSFAISQPARYMNDFETLGFNEDEQGRRVFDGIENWLGGGSGIGLNYRFAQPGRTERNRQNHLYPEGVFPFSYPVLTDKLSGKTSGRAAGYIRKSNFAKVLEINSANEYWVKAASLLHTDLQGNDLADPENVRFYLISGMQHGSGSSAGICQQLQNPTKPEPVLRALFIALDAWVTNGTAPPESNVPRRTKGTAAMAVVMPGLLTGVVPKAVLGWPNIPGVTYTGLVTIRRYFDYGSQINKGIISSYSTGTKGYPAYFNFVSKVNQDGNEVAGIRLPPVAAPIATLTGWALRSEKFGLNDGGESAGQSIYFKTTKAERLAAGDPRLSLEERYGSHKGYVEAVTKAVEKLEAERLLLPADTQDYIQQAESSNILK
ncbi:MAG: tannase/feruloyl esterase family alpha/beta hydrolase [Sphingobacteriaceae bacterium]|nr:MAG: tannase/feruloyl esterase family alpha/beta hydrolase [Sphingobacteriaceae bacterium]